MEQLNDDILDLIDSVEITTKKELKYIQENDWTLIKEAKFKEDEFDLQNTLVLNAIGHATNLFTLAKSDLRHPKVKETLDSLLKSIPLHTGRVSKYISESDYLNSDLDKGAMKAEMEFQSIINKSATGIKSKVRKLNYTEDSNSLDIQTFNNTPIPLLMFDTFLNRYPEIEDYIEAKRKKSQVIEEPTPKVRKKKK